ASIWFTWWLGDTIGSVLLTPLLVLWSINPHIRWNLSQVFERVLFLAFFLFVNLVVFGGLIPLSKENYPLEFLCVPFFIWAAFRFGPRETATAVVVLAGITIWGTLQGHGPFATRSSGESLLLLQSFMGVKAVMSLVLSALVAGYRRVETELLHLARSPDRTIKLPQIHRRARWRDQTRIAYGTVFCDSIPGREQPKSHQRSARPRGRQPGTLPGGECSARVVPFHRHGRAFRWR